MSSNVIWSGPIRSPLRRYGGKALIARSIVSLFPAHRVFVEPFFGAGNVLFTKSSSEVEVVNDLDPNLMALWRCIQDDVDCNNLSKLLSETVNDKTNYEQCRLTFPTCIDRIERLRQYFVLTQCSYNAAFCAGWSRPSRPADVGVFHNRVNRFPLAQRRMRSVETLNCHFRDVLPRYDAADSLIYCDPPYLHSTRSAKSKYQHEMRYIEHAELLSRLSGTKAMAILSGYPSPLYDEALSSWTRLVLPVRKHAPRGINRSKGTASEIIWMNPRCYEVMEDTIASLLDTGDLRLAA